MNSIAIHCSHDTNVCFKDKNGEYVVYELERITQERYFSLNKSEKKEYWVKELAKIIRSFNGIESFDICYYSETNEETLSLFQTAFGIKEFKQVWHHPSHAMGAYWLSPFYECLILSFDGGGWDGDKVTTFNIYKCVGGKLELLNSLPHNFCDAYTMLAWPISEIRKNGDNYEDSYLSMAGKLMGLSGCISEAFKSLYYFPEMEPFFNGNINFTELEILGKKTDLKLERDSLVGQDSLEIAHQSQVVFNKLVFNAIEPYILKNRLPLIITGGGALNVVCNSYLKKNLGVQIFVPPNPSDCGLSFGALLLNEPPTEKIESITYNGFPIIDKGIIISNYGNDYYARFCNIKQLARLIVDGAIVGIMNGNCEVGARALMNRSIVCNPAVAGMKDKLNNDIKFRESFRPLAPVVREGQVTECFEWNELSPYMSFNVSVKPEAINKIQACVHVDNSARIQTVSEQQNPFAYELLTEVNQLNSVGVLLNTSLNSKGKPMVTYIKDALEILSETKLDYLYIEGALISKRMID